MNSNCQQPRGIQEGLTSAFQLCHAGITEAKVYLKMRRDNVQTKQEVLRLFFFWGQKYSSDTFHSHDWWFLHVPFFHKISSSVWLRWYPEQNATAQNSSWLLPSNVLTCWDWEETPRSPLGGDKQRVAHPSFYLEGGQCMRRRHLGWEAPWRAAARPGDGGSKSRCKPAWVLQRSNSSSASLHTSL